MPRQAAAQREKEANQSAPPSDAPLQSLIGRAQGSDTTRAAMLARILLTDTDASVRRTAAWGLNDLRTVDSRDALIRALRSDKDWEVREMSAWALADYHGDVVSNALTEGLHDKTAKVRAISY